ncbi:hypothetical protein K491DRAFT_776159 [Lophiostoma macrostomum CBS 122681]|uniref:Zn(2)-C6 fungal-type domain-containing protein n=1 Tax=Lophiostoma macrostomum CBS 122681 TaxID=1314788 RepID=A0A6A6TFC7_9PLEO|nr:hypothetical protein K491DRAFT_776159 [Lophiostoma macrostomum CBS 122681]
MPTPNFHQHLHVPAGPASAPRPKRVKIDVACGTCRMRKVKCDGARPACGSCSRKLDLRETCSYSQNTHIPRPQRPTDAAPNHPSDIPSFSPAEEPPQVLDGSHLSRRRLASFSGPGYQRISPRQDPGTGSSITSQSPAETLNSRSTKDHATNSRSAAISNSISSSIIDSMTAVPDEGTRTREFFGSSSAGSFTAQIKRALDARLAQTGSAPADHPSLSSTSATNAIPKEAPAAVDYVLPARRQADHLMALYWKYVDPLYPFLHKPKWDRSYEAIFAGSVTDIEEHVFVATLNTIFALSVRLSESLTPEQRDEASSQFFQRAQELLPLNIWNTGTVEQVQYLLLISQYSQSTDYPQRTWMVVGSAVRMAQGLGLHLPDASADRSNADERELLRRIWHGCVLMDRVVAVTHGRPAMIPSHVARRVPLPLIDRISNDETHSTLLGNTPDHASLFVKSVELYEIMYRTILAVYYSDGGPLPKCVSNPHNRELSGEDEDLAIGIQLDGALRKWQRSLPEHLKLQTAEMRSEIAHRQAVILHIRFLHARILLLRPFLTRFCLAHSTESTDHYDSLQARIIQQSASLCVDTAKSLISVLQEYQTQDETVGLLPVWWYRVYYAYTAATVLIAANLRPEVFPASVLGIAWSRSMAVLKAHEKFGYSARRCVAALHMLSSKLLLHEHGTGTGSGTSTRAGTARANEQHSLDQPTFTEHDPNLLLQPVDEFPFAFEDFEQLQVADFDIDANSMAWFNDMHAAWGLLNER